MNKTSKRLAEGLGNLLLGQKEIDDQILSQLEDALLAADLGLATTQDIIARAMDKTRRQSLNNFSALVESLRLTLIDQLEPAQGRLTPDPSCRPFVILFVGVNGAGKTTTIGKLGYRLQQDGLSVLLAAGDTFRAAATEQLAVWGERIGATVISQQQGADAGAVIFDAITAAQSRKVDVVLADTSGRLHNNKGLMDELKKIQQIMAKFDRAAPHEVMLVLDATTGRNGLQQVLQFQQTSDISGLIISKLDGTAKGGFVVEANQQTGVPIYYVGVGEKLDALEPFSAKLFVEALLSDLLEEK